MSDSDSRLVTVFKSQGMLQAQVIRGKLESAGIPVFLKYEAIGQLFGLTIDGLGLVQVQVPSGLAEQAGALLDEETLADDLPPDGGDIVDARDSFPPDEGQDIGPTVEPEE